MKTITQLLLTLILFISFAFTQIEIDTLWTFTNCGQEGREGPTIVQCEAEYEGTSLEDQITMPGFQGYQEWTVPFTGIYTIEVYGAQGGDEQYNPGGLGAMMKGEFYFESASLIKILVGQRTALLPSTGNRRSAGGGGGFIVDNNNNPIIIASGGGGASSITGNYVFGNISQNAASGGDGSGSGGINGSGGSQGSSSGGAGGAGWFSNGVIGNEGNTGGYRFIEGGYGGERYYAANNNYGSVGGFGGGGGGWAGGAGGGGYSGGGGGAWNGSSSSYSGGGGGSFIAEDAELISAESGVNEGHGLVVITLLSPLDGVIINEIMVQPINTEFGEIFSEYIELTNIGEEAVDLNGYSILTNSGSATIEESLIIEPGGFVVLASTDNPSLNLGLNVDYTWGFSTGIEFDNSGETITLTNAYGYTVDEVTIDGSMVLEGSSLELKNPALDNSNIFNWANGSTAYDSEGNQGTPGEDNDAWEPVADIEVTGLDFGSLYLNESSTLTANITNVGEGTLFVTEFQNTEADGFEFILLETPFELAQNESIEFDVTFTPTEEANYAHSITVVNNAPGEENKNLTLTGWGGLPYLELSSTSYTAPDAYVPDTTQISIPLQNSGYYELVISEASFEDGTQFGLESELPFVVQPQSTENILINFYPNSAGSLTDNFTITTNDPNNYPTATFNLSGYAYLPQITMQSDTLYFPTVHVDDDYIMNLYIENTGTGTLSLNNYQIDNPIFYIEGDSLDICEGCGDYLNIHFNPDAISEFSGILTFETNDYYMPEKSLTLIGNALSNTLVLVPFDYSEIQDAYNNADDGDTIVISPGVYNGENVQIDQNKSIMISSMFVLNGDSAYIENTKINRRFSFSGSQVDSTTIV